jgi:hypothetical protein
MYVRVAEGREHRRDERRTMMKLIALLAAASAVAAAVFFWRKQGQPSMDSMWSSAEEAVSSWGETAANEAGKAADTFMAAADDATTNATDTAGEVEDAIAKAKESGGS